MQEEFFSALAAGDPVKMESLLKKRLDQVIPAEKIINEDLVPAMEKVGVKFQKNEIFLPEVMLAARTMQVGLKILQPKLAGGKREFAGRVVIGTVQGDYHDIGKNLVAMMLEGAGYEVFDLGTDVSPERFVGGVRKHQAHLLGMSALLTTTMPVMEQIVRALAEAGLRDKVKVMAGGAPVTRDYAGRIGADGYAPDAGAAVELAKKLRRM